MPKFLSRIAVFTATIFVANFASIATVQAEVPYTYWAEDGVVLDTVPEDEEVESHAIASDGAGGAFIAWIRSYPGDLSEVFVQKVNASGQPQWTANGIQVTTLGGLQSTPLLVADGSGGVFVAWRLYDDVTVEVYAQRINAAGALQWGDGISMTLTPANSKQNHSIISDGAGGIIVAWHETRDAFLDIFAQRINAAGSRLWDAEGEAVYQDTVSNAYDSKVISDGSGGVIVAWVQVRGDSNVYGQRLNNLGAQQWLSTGIVINDEAETQFLYGLISDGATGAIAMWEDERGGPGARDVYVQKINASGALQWTATGVLVSPDGSVSFALNNGITTDTAGGAMVAWNDIDNGQMRAQKVTSAGSLSWAAAGVRLAGEAAFSNVSLVTTNGVDMIAVWDHYVSVESDEFYMIHSQYVDSAGDVKWGDNGLSIYEGTSFNYHNNPLIVNDANIGGVVVWSPSEEDSSNYHEVRVQGISHAYQIADLDAGLDSIDEAGNNIEVGTVNGLVGNDELVRVTKDSDNTVISDVLTDMIEDHSWDDVRGYNDVAAGKAVITGLGSAPGTAGVHTLYVPFVTGDTQLIICPDADTLSAVTDDCSNQVIFTEGQTKSVGSDSVTVTKTTIDSQVYWAAAGVSGTGGFSTAEAGELPSTGSNQEILIVSAMLLISLGSLGAVKAMREDSLC